MPNWKKEISQRLVDLKLAPAREAEIIEELAQHLDDRYQELRTAGATEAHAHRIALQEIRDQQVLVRELRKVEHMPTPEPVILGVTRKGNIVTDLRQDLRFGLRMLAKNPGFTIVAVLTLALGIGANTAIFSLIDAVMLRWLPVRNPQQLVVLKWSARQWPVTENSYAWSGCPIKAAGAAVSLGRSASAPLAAEGCSFSYPMFEQIRAEKQLFEGVVAFASGRQLGVSMNGNTTLAAGDFVSRDFFSTLGVSAMLGRTLGPGEATPSAAPALVLSYGYWKRQFGGNPAALGKPVILTGDTLGNRGNASSTYTVVGVMPPTFLSLDPGWAPDMWLPLSSPFGAAYWPKDTDASSWWLLVVARLKRGVTAVQAQAAIQVIFSRGVTEGAKPMLKPEDSPRLELVSAAHGLASMRKSFSEPLFLLMIAVGIVLLIACANVAGLSLVRATRRQRELAVRVALGAAPRRVVRQLFTESILIAAIGGVLGVLVAYAGARFLVTFLSANWYSPIQIDVHPDWRVLAFTLAVTALTGVLFGVGPALRGTRVDLNTALKQTTDSLGGRSSAGRRSRFANTLVAAQVALSTLVLVAALLLVRTLVKLETMDVGFDTRNLLTFSISPQLSGYKGQRLANLYRDLQTRLGAIPGVLSVSYSGVPLLSGGLSSQEIYFSDPSKPSTEVALLTVGPDFFETMRIPLLTGRLFTVQEFENSQQGHEPRALVVNKAFARRFFGGQNAIGQRIGFEEKKPPNTEIVGVVGDTKYDSLRKEIEPTFYFPQQGGTFEVRTVLNPQALITSIRGVVGSVASDVPVFDMKTQRELIDRTIYQERLVARLSGLFGLLSLALASVGLYGLLSYEVARRTHEVGIRMALGASRGEVLSLVVGRGIRLVAAGTAIGIPAALGLMRYLQSVVYGVHPVDPVTYAAVVILLSIVALAACYIPARRATKVDPLVALRYE